MHSEACPVGSAVHLDFSGLPCPDNSRANRKRKFQEGDSGIVYITWAKRHCQKQTPLLILENVLVARLIQQRAGFCVQCSAFCDVQEVDTLINSGRRHPYQQNPSIGPSMPNVCLAQGLNMDAVRELLERDYFLHQLDVSPADAGHFGVSRRRTYIYCAHRRTSRHLFDVHEAYAKVSRVLRRKIHTRPSDYFIATDRAIQLAAQQTAIARRIQYQPVSRLHLCMYHKCVIRVLFNIYVWALLLAC